MNTNSFIEPLLRYVEKKTKSFLESHDLVNDYDSILEYAKGAGLFVEEYINRLLNETVKRVADKENREWNDVKDEFCSHYLKG